MKHRVGRDAVLSADAPSGRFSAVFEDDGETAYFYGLDPDAKEAASRSPIVDALHIYDVDAMLQREDPYSVEIRWAEGRNRVGLFIDGECHAVFDFDEKRAVCQSGFPPASGAFTSSHEWDDELTAGF